MGVFVKFLIDFLPMVFFFAAYKLTDVYTATLVLMVCSILQVIYLKIRHGKVEPMMWISLGFILVFGSMTFEFKNPRFLQWKVSILNWLFALAFLSVRAWKKTSLIQLMSQNRVHLPTAVWKTLDGYWITYFSVIGALNLLIAYTCSMNTWVTFKVFGIIGCTILFVVIQGFYIHRKTREKPRLYQTP